MPTKDQLLATFQTIRNFLNENPDSGPKFPGKSAPQPGSEDYYSRLLGKFLNGRDPKSPAPPETVPDNLVSFILEHYFDIDAKKLDQIKVDHALSMGAENMVGDILERYIATVLEPKGWIWCSGSVLKSIDFIKRTKTEWILLQIKNRDNSENSSSSAVRKNTTILKWFRTFAKTGKTNWENFPDPEVAKHLSEKDFLAFVKTYLETLKSKSP